MDEGSRGGAELVGDAGLATSPTVPPLAVGGLVVTRAALVAALRAYVPQVVDVQALDGERFLLVLASAVSGQGSDREEE